MHVVTKTVWALLLCSVMGAQAAPAPWYWWTSRHDGHRICAQHMPSQGWQRAEGPFQNPRCESPRKALIPSMR